MEDHIGECFNAIERKDIPTIGRLLCEGVPVGVFGGESPMCLAVLTQIPEVVDLMLRQGVPVMMADSFLRTTPLHHACAGGMLAIARRLVAAGADVSATDIDGDTPLIYLMRGSRETTADACEILKLLLEQGADPTIRNGDRITALDMARRKDLTAYLRILDEWMTPFPDVKVAE